MKNKFKEFLEENYFVKYLIATIAGIWVTAILGTLSFVSPSIVVAAALTTAVIAITTICSGLAQHG